MYSDLQTSIYISIYDALYNTTLLLLLSGKVSISNIFSCQNLLSDLAALKIVHVRSREIFLSPFRMFVFAFIKDLIQNPLMSKGVFQWGLDQVLNWVN